MNKKQTRWKKLFNLTVQSVRGMLGLKIKPLMIANISVTSKCNIFCKSCNIGRDFVQDPKIAENDLTIDEIERFFSSNRNFLDKVGWIQLTGGEPFLRQDLVQIMDIIKRFLPDCRLWVPTNGSVPTRIIAQVEKCLKVGNLEGVSVSLHGKEAYHDEFTGVKGTYNKALATVRGLIDLRKNFPQLRISLSFTLFQGNYRELLDIFDLSKQLDVDFTFRSANYSGLYYKHKEADFRSNIYTVEIEREIEALIEKMGLNKKWGDLRLLARLYYFKGIIRFLREPHRRILPCLAGASSCFIDSEGNVYPCLFVDKKIGNIRKQTLAEMWDLLEVKNLQKAIRKGKCPNCWVECETYRRIYENPYKPGLYALKYAMNNNVILD